MSKERELLERWLDDTIFEPEELDSLMEETRELLAQPKQASTARLGKNTISLRDHFAGLAMQGMLTKVSTTVGADSVAMAAYHVAHQMLKERSRGEKRDD